MTHPKAFATAALALILGGGCATPPRDSVPLSASEAQVCADQGNCIVISRDDLTVQIRRAIQEGKRMERASCGTDTKWIPK